ncbi:MAG: biotin transport system ATP-binding protein [Rhodobacteraceae bacterium HLUCCA12]|nr:MAG: biotin transport system ATP-binding protein [Rhodobacteraceae bacterium HLUCCA12]
MPPTPHIELSDVTFSRDGRVVIDAVTLSLSERRIGIVGRNGSGKSTLLRLIAGLQAPDRGQIRVAGVDVMSDRKAAIRALGILFQNPDHQIIFPTVEEEIAFGLTQLGATRGAARARARAVLQAHGRADWADRSTHTLSQGQRHYLCLMAVLAMEPAAILMDEPFTGLDLPTTMQLNRILADLDQQLVVVTHAPALLEGFDRVLWLDEGRLRADGPAAAVLHDFTAEMRALGGHEPCWP